MATKNTSCILSTGEFNRMVKGKNMCLPLELKCHWFPLTKVVLLQRLWPNLGQELMRVG